MLSGVTIILFIFIFIINISLTFTIIFLERKNPQSTYAWLLFIWIFPIIGFLFYLFLSQNFKKRKIFNYNTLENKQYHHLLTQQRQSLHQLRSHASDTLLKRHEKIIKFHLNVSESLYTDNNVIDLYTDGHEKFDALFHAMEQATSSIHIEYYIIKNDTLARKIFDILTRKALEHVEVRLLFDAMGGRYIPKTMLSAFESAGGKIGVFFPSFFKSLNFQVNYRNHRKIVVIDGKIGFIGGFNIGNEYLGLNKKMGYWRDTHLRVRGSAATELQHRFLLDWRVASNEELHIDEGNLKHYFPSLKKRSGAGIQIVSSGPNNINQAIKQGFLQMINDATRYILIQSPYFVPDESILEALKIALLSDIDVQIMIPNKPDHVFIYWATLSYVGELIEHGAKIFIYENGFLHAKTIIVDDAVCSVGSCNFDIRSFSLNFETNAFIYDQHVTIQLRETFLDDIQKCTYYSRERYLKRKSSIKIKESICRLFSPLL